MAEEFIECISKAVYTPVKKVGAMARLAPYIPLPRGKESQQIVDAQAKP